MQDFDQPEQRLDIEHYMQLVVRQKWFILVPMLAGLLLMGMASLLMQDLYSAKATILVEQPSLPTDFMKSTIPYGPETYVRTLVEQIKSTTRLEKIILDNQLYPEQRQKRPIEEVVAFMRERIKIESRANDTFSVSFTGEDPEVVARITNKLTEMFIEENLRYRLERSAQNVAFLESQARALRDQVSEQERRIQQFKSQNLDRLPEQRTANQVQLASLNQRLQSVSEALSTAGARLNSAKDRIAILGDGYDEERGGNVSSQDSLESRVEKARQELATLRAQLSERHPDIKLKQKEVTALEAQLASAPRASAPAKRRARNPELLRAIDDERTAQGDLVRYQNELTRVQEELTKVNERLEDTPRVELELNELTKGMTVLKEQADSFQKKATDAAASFELERQNQGSQFRALDTARIPTKPDSPNRPLLVAIGGLIGLGLGMLLVIGMDLLFRPFLDEQDLERFASLPVLVSVPHLGPFPSDWLRFRRQLANLLNFLLGALPRAGSDYAVSGLRVPQRAEVTPPWVPQNSTKLAPKARGFTYLTGDPLDAAEGASPEVAVQTSQASGGPALGADAPLYGGKTSPWHARAHQKLKPETPEVPTPARAAVKAEAEKPVGPGVAHQAGVPSQAGSTVSRAQEVPPVPARSAAPGQPPVPAKPASTAALVKPTAASPATATSATAGATGTSGAMGTTNARETAAAPSSATSANAPSAGPVLSARAPQKPESIPPAPWETPTSKGVSAATLLAHAKANGAASTTQDVAAGVGVPTVGGGGSARRTPAAPAPGNGSDRRSLTGLGRAPERFDEALKRGAEAILQPPPTGEAEPLVLTPSVRPQRSTTKDPAELPVDRADLVETLLPLPLAPASARARTTETPAMQLGANPPGLKSTSVSLPTPQWGHPSRIKVRPAPVFDMETLQDEPLQGLSHRPPWLAEA